MANIVYRDQLGAFVCMLSTPVSPIKKKRERTSYIKWTYTPFLYLPFPFLKLNFNPMTSFDYLWQVIDPADSYPQVKDTCRKIWDVLS